jgi:hypothetical protein
MTKEGKILALFGDQLSDVALSASTLFEDEPADVV